MNAIDTFRISRVEYNMYRGGRWVLRYILVSNDISEDNRYSFVRIVRAVHVEDHERVTLLNEILSGEQKV